MDALTYYATQSVVTDPGEMAGCFAGLPNDVAGLRRVARGLVIHYRGDDPLAHGIPEERLAEVDTRYAEPMLRRLMELDARPLSAERAPEKRLVGCCRDFTVLFLAMARHAGIPARARVGFATSFAPGLNVDHEVAEVWDAGERRWRLVDAELGDVHVDPTDGKALDPLDLPRDRFLVGGTAWHACRAGEADPARFLVDPGLDVPQTRGWPYLLHNLIHDLAALNKEEMLLWDAWGLMERDSLTPAKEDLLDRIAAVTRAIAPDFIAARALYADEPGPRVPPVVTSYSPLTGLPRQVRVKT